jgi:hypothetical protein
MTRHATRVTGKLMDEDESHAKAKGAMSYMRAREHARMASTITCILAPIRRIGPTSSPHRLC